VKKSMTSGASATGLYVAGTLLSFLNKFTASLPS
jgi:hypothetical protein